MTNRRELIEVEPRIKEYEPYAYWLLGVPRAGYRGAKCSNTDKLLASAWSAMIQRCYASTAVNHPRYGAKGVSVCKRWHQVANFIGDVKALHGWGDKLRDWPGYQLDKDYYSSNQYSPETCVWLSLKENALYLSSVKPVRVTRLGEETVYLSVTEAARATSVLRKNIGNWLTGEHKQLTDLDYKFEHYIATNPLRRAL